MLQSAQDFILLHETEHATLIYYGKVEVSNGRAKQLVVGIEKCNIWVLDDFNYPDIDRDNLFLNSNNEINFDVFDERNPFQLVRTPTHIKGNILDIVATSNRNLVEMLVLDHPFSDH